MPFLRYEMQRCFFQESLLCFQASSSVSLRFRFTFTCIHSVREPFFAIREAKNNFPSLQFVLECLNWLKQFKMQSRGFLSAIPHTSLQIVTSSHISFLDFSTLKQSIHGADTFWSRLEKDQATNNSRLLWYSPEGTGWARMGFGMEVLKPIIECTRYFTA